MILENKEKLQKIKKQKKTVTTQEDQFEYLKNIVFLMPGNIYWIGTDGICQGCNQNFIDLMGVGSKEDLIGKSPYSLMPKKVAKVAKENDQKVIKSGQELCVEEVGFNKDGKEECSSTKKMPLYDKQGKISGVLTVSMTITNRKCAENLAKEKEIAQQKIKNLRILGSTIAHELRNPLGAIMLQYDLIETRLTQIIEELIAENHDKYESKYAEHFSQAFAAGRQINNVIKRTVTTIDLLLNNIKEEVEISNKKFKKTSILADIKEAIEIYPFVGDEREKIRYAADKDFTYFGNAKLTRLILVNLIKNALYHIKLAGHGSIHIFLKSDDNNNYLVFHDTGPGIPKEFLSKIFNRFFTGRAGGTGLGLTFCKMVMQIYGGDITCTSEEGKFTEFTLIFPKIQ